MGNTLVWDYSQTLIVKQVQLKSALEFRPICYRVQGFGTLKVKEYENS